MQRTVDSDGILSVKSVWWTAFNIDDITIRQRCVFLQNFDHRTKRCESISVPWPTIVFGSSSINQRDHRYSLCCWANVLCFYHFLIRIIILCGEKAVLSPCSSLLFFQKSKLCSSTKYACWSDILKADCAEILFCHKTKARMFFFLTGCLCRIITDI